ncbi:hypothetical protein [Pedobacter westerhofensis]|uniref:hypothetical protein n=1 Tax=Pedobacter westerhofensis TaxID=425512 RepID=UPI00163D57C5
MLQIFVSAFVQQGIRQQVMSLQCKKRCRIIMMLLMDLCYRTVNVGLQLVVMYSFGDTKCTIQITETDINILPGQNFCHFKQHLRLMLR